MDTLVGGQVIESAMERVEGVIGVDAFGEVEVKSRGHEEEKMVVKG